MTYFVQKKKKGRVGTGNQAVGGNVLTLRASKSSNPQPSGKTIEFGLVAIQKEKEERETGGRED